MTPEDPEPLLVTLTSYDAGAADYSEHSQDRSALQPLHQRFAGLVRDGGAVLDLGCGPGHDAAELSAYGLRVIGCDASRGLLLQAKRHSSISGRLVLSEARSLPFASETFDGIWACASLLHVAKTQVAGALREALRVAKPGAVFFTSMQAGSGSMVPDRSVEGLPERYYFFYQADEWLSLVRAAGFELLDQCVNPTTNGLTDGAVGWIETYARKPL